MARSLRRRAPRLLGALFGSGDHCLMTALVRVGVGVTVCLASGCGAPEPTPPPVRRGGVTCPPARQLLVPVRLVAGRLLRVDPRP